LKTVKETSVDKLLALVIDDSREIRDYVIEYILEPNGFEVIIAKDGVEGLQQIMAGRPDLILLDYEMPRLTGYEVLLKLQEHGIKIPTILMTSHGSEQLAIEVFRLGVQDYVIKPFTTDTMLKAIEDAVAVARLKREKEQLTRRVILANHELEQRVNELNELYRVGKSITALNQPGKTLERIVEAVLSMTRSEECTLNLIDTKTGESKGHLTRRRYDDSRQAAAQGTKLLDPNVVDGNGARPGSPETVLSVPLQVGQKTVGALSISKRVNGNFTTHDNRILRMLADYAAIALHNMQLMRQLQATKEHEKRQIRGLFERYVGPKVVEQMLAQPEKVKLGGKRQDITVLFADVRGFSTFSAKTSPEILIELLNQYIRVAADAVLAEEGTLDKFMGDAVMAFFNAPMPQSDHALRAVRAAWKLCRAVERLHRYLVPAHRLHFGVGVGIGEVVVGNIGTPQMMNFTVIGDSVNKVKRLQENARPGQILINRETYHLLHDRIKARHIDDIQLKGQSQPEPVYEVLELWEH
jgi:class 3 adenylate cyclase/DNA-binding response OmpR family regulator